MLIKCIQLFSLPEIKEGQQKKYSLREVAINTDHIIEAKEDVSMDILIKDHPEQFPQGLSPAQKFTVVIMTTRSLVVVGELADLIKKTNKDSKLLLKG